MPALEDFTEDSLLRISAASGIPYPDLTAGIADDRTTCRVCGCTEDDCSECIAETGYPCRWVETDLCSRCVHIEARRAFVRVTLMLFVLGSALALFSWILL